MELIAKLPVLRNSHLLALVCTFLTTSTSVFCQKVVDTSFRQKSINNLTDFYRSSIGLQAHLYNGPLYEQYTRRFYDGHQYYVSDSITKGFVSYDGMGYSDIRMQYDMIRDELIISHPNGFAINLIKEKVDSFRLFDHLFVKLENLKIPGSQNFIGYYEKVYSSPSISFLVARRKYTEEITERTTVESKVYAKNFYYIVRDGVYHQVKNKKSVLELFKDKKQETQQYIKKNGLRFKEFEQDVLQLVSYFDQLI
jgi:hypothetical protein